MTRRIAVFTSSRADLGPLGPVISALDQHDDVALVVIASGTHTADSFGGRLGDIPISDRSEIELVDAAIAATDPAALSDAFARIAVGVSRVLTQRPIDLLVLLGDRWELLAVASAALIHGVPIAHLHGGETTEGAIDERIRHGITKLSDLHLCASPDSAMRIRNMGEQPWRIIVTGAPGLDRMGAVVPASDERLRHITGSPIVRPLGVVVYHPPTVDRANVATRARAVLEAAAGSLGSVLVLYPGADPGSDAVVDEIEQVTSRHPNVVAVRNLGEEYLSVLASADVLIGNSSSGIIEAASLELPVVDVGDRRARPAPPSQCPTCGRGGGGHRPRHRPCTRSGLPNGVGWDGQPVWGRTVGRPDRPGSPRRAARSLTPEAARAGTYQRTIARRSDASGGRHDPRRHRCHRSRWLPDRAGCRP